MHNKLLIPGPTEVEDSVLDWLSRPVEAHYGDYWVSVHNETIDLLRRVFGTAGKVFMLPGSGSLAADAAVQSVFAPGQRVLLGINGHFGHRWREILTANGVTPVIVDIPPDQPLPPEAFDAALAADPGLAGVVVVHLETSTSVLNPLQELAAVARKHNRLIMADAVSSLGGTPLPMDEWGVDVCVSGSQKCLGGVAGLGIVAVNDRAWQAIANQPDYPRSWYLDLRRWQWYVENWGDWHPFPVTMPCSVVLALRAALQSLLAEGLDARFARYEQLAAHLRQGLEDLGMRLFVPHADGPRAHRRLVPRRRRLAGDHPLPGRRAPRQDHRRLRPLQALRHPRRPHGQRHRRRRHRPVPRGPARISPPRRGGTRSRAITSPRAANLPPPDLAPAPHTGGPQRRGTRSGGKSSPIAANLPPPDLVPTCLTNGPGNAPPPPCPPTPPAPPSEAACTSPPTPRLPTR